MRYHAVMIEHLHPTPDVLLTDRGFAVAQAAGIIAIEAQPDHIAAIGDFMRSEAGRDLPAPANELDFTVYWSGGRRPSQWDTHFHDAVPGFSYYDANQLAQLQPSKRVAVTKASIAARGTHIIELSTEHFETPLSSALARALVTPAPQASAFDASPKDWLKQVRAALTPKGFLDAMPKKDMFKHAGEPALEAEVAKRFPDAFRVTRL